MLIRSRKKERQGLNRAEVKGGRGLNRADGLYVRWQSQGRDGGSMELWFGCLLTELKKQMCAKGLRNCVAWCYCG